jgi:hypothetical protein
MDRRTLLKIMGGIAALPALGKAIKGAGIKTTKAAKVAGKVLPKVQGMPEWFSPLVNKILKEGKDVSPKVSRVEDMTTVKKLEIPSATGEPEVITLTQNKTTGEISIEANFSGGTADAPFELNYRPPKSDINLETGKEVKYPGEFSVVEQRPKPLSEPGDFEFDYESLNVGDAFSDIEKLEKIGTGKIKDVKKIEERAKGRKMLEQSPYEDIINRYPDPDIGDYDYADGGIASFANGGKVKNKSKAEEPLSKYKSYSENELLSSLDAKMPNLQIEDDVYYGMPSSEYLPKREYFDLANGGRAGYGLGGMIKKIIGQAKSIVSPIATGAATPNVMPTAPTEIIPPASNSLTRPLGMAGFGGSEIVDILKRLGYSFADGGSVQTGLTKTVPPVKGPDSQGVETLFKRRYN